MVDDILFDLLHAEMVCTYSDMEKNSNELKVSTLEQIGFTTGFRHVERLTRDWARFRNELDVVKFICKDFWSSVFKKEISNLRTNNHGVYVLYDNKFRFSCKLSPTDLLLKSSPQHLAFTCGLVRGALANLGITAVVLADIAEPSGCKFQVISQRV